MVCLVHVNKVKMYLFFHSHYVLYLLLVPTAYLFLCGYLLRRILRRVR
jgi:hypothetical protein